MTTPRTDLTAQIGGLLTAYANATAEERQRMHDAMAATGITADEAAKAAVQLVGVFNNPAPERTQAEWCDLDGHVWTSRMAQATETCRRCGTVRRKFAGPEPETVTVTLPRDVVEAQTWHAVAEALREHCPMFPHTARLLDAMSDALDAANTPPATPVRPPEATESDSGAGASAEAGEGSGGESDDRLDAACDWSDFRKDYGVSPDPKVSDREYLAFQAGWTAGRHGDQSGVLR